MRLRYEILGGLALVGLFLLAGWLWSLGSTLGYWPRVAGIALAVVLVYQWGKFRR